MTSSRENTNATVMASRGNEHEFPFEEKDYRFLSTIVYERSGIVLGPQKVNMVYSRLARRLRALRLRSFHEYCALLSGKHGQEELGFLINAITTNLTRFFREPHHFDHLRTEVFSEIAKGETRRLRIWSAGCSSGEEPYSIAMTVMHAIPDLDRWDARVLATDLDTSMVETGMAGAYPVAALDDLSREIRAKYCQSAAKQLHHEGVWTVAEPVKKLVTFKHLNLHGHWPMKGPFDVIFCRNVMIYFDAETKAKLVRRFAELLRPGGWLYIGHAESLQNDGAGLRLAGRTIYRKPRQ